ncbi:type IV secretory system conjugative DNA transfer family protein [Streptomyces sp. 2112.2]|uniref:type IV secretory system conjugative DNA transfer family protein n=1 Tax=Streptomyces sp. 2112.2 TaxID=1881024 RepID=UPI00115FD1D7|nr:TraM recognition domain-containing protein [Streptomyces sp. 2112.2]
MAVSSLTKRRGGETGVSPYLLPAAMGVLFALLGVGWVAAAVGAALADRSAPPSNPFTLPFALARGSYRWPGPAGWLVLSLELLALAVVGGLAARAVRRRRRTRLPIDAAARHMGKGRDLGKISEAGARATATRLGVDGDRPPGVFIGYTVIGRRPVYGSPEDTHVDIWGTRTGKTTRKAIPAIMRHGAAPCLVTSNKRDVVDATRLGRGKLGNVWVFDLQGLIGEQPTTWWWNPLTAVTDVVSAARMAEHFAADSRKSGAQTDAYFEPSGQELLANFLLAAALDNRPITQVYEWTSNPREAEPARILAAKGPEFALAASSVQGMLNAPEKQRGGVYGTARLMASVLRSPAVTQWVTPTTGLGKRREFSPEDFVRSTDTLYLVSREGAGSAGALVTALTVAVCEAAEAYAARSARGRLPRELLAVLDEAANVCRWSDLPDRYSHYGSRGIELMTILQSWPQGVEVWGERGMAKLFSSANIRTYGGGVLDEQFLGMLKSAIGPYELRTVSTTVQPSHGSGGGLFGSNRSRSYGERDDEIVNVADLVAMPPGRALLIASGTRPTLVETVPWWDTDFADLVQESLNTYDPGART